MSSYVSNKKPRRDYSAQQASGKRESVDDEFSDDGIDWDAVEQMADSAAASNTLDVISISSTESSPVAKKQQTNAQALENIRPRNWSKPMPPSSSTKPTPCSPPPSSVDKIQEGLPRELQFDPSQLKAVSDEYLKTLVRHANVSQPLLNGWTLFPHQKRAILSAIRMRRQILALDMGLGKTLIGCCWSRAFVQTFPSCRVILICPVSLKKEWKRTLEEATGLIVEDEKAKGNTTYDVTIASWAKVPKPPVGGDYVVVADEAHAMQSMTSARTKNSLKLMEKALGVLLLTGTPLKNGQPSNLFPLLKAVKHPFGKYQKAYEFYFCEGREFRVNGMPVWQAKGAANLEQLRNCTASHVLFLRKDECLKELPPQTRVIRTVPVSARATIQHTQAVMRLRQAHENASGNSEAVLGAVQNLRLVSSIAKIDASVQIAKSILEKEPAIVIFTSFQQVAASIHKKLSEDWPCELLTGQTPAPQRQRLVDNFQAGSSAVFVATFGAGGVGLTLTAAHTILLVDRPWSPGEVFQAEDRVRRIGQKHPVTSIWISAFELDEQMNQLLISKNSTANAVLAGGSDGGSNAKISILKLVESVLPKLA